MIPMQPSVAVGALAPGFRTVDGYSYMSLRLAFEMLPAGRLDTVG